MKKIKRKVQLYAQAFTIYGEYVLETRRNKAGIEGKTGYVIHTVQELQWRAKFAKKCGPTTRGKAEFADFKVIIIELRQSRSSYYRPSI